MFSFSVRQSISNIAKYGVFDSRTPLLIALALLNNSPFALILKTLNDLNKLAYLLR